MMNLRGLVEKSADTDLLREMTGFAAEQLMDLEAGAKTGADYGEKSVERLAQQATSHGADRFWMRHMMDKQATDSTWRDRLHSKAAGQFQPSVEKPAAGILSLHFVVQPS
ncbi:hypothetical protein AL035_05765 [Salipiger aestuarii]|nr:hypothetical protein AL035_05765 [Salipiger aestuarii]